jgi:hypothetical protein
MADDRERLPAREQIDAIQSISALDQLLEDVVEARMAIESQLEFSSRDAEWEGRALGALTAHRICEHNIRRKIARLSGRTTSNTEAEATKALTKAQNIQNNLLAQKAAEVRRQTANLERKTKALEGIRKAMDRANFLVHFHRAAHNVLDETACRSIQAEAQRLHAEAINQDVDDAK